MRAHIRFAVAVCLAVAGGLILASPGFAQEPAATEKPAAAAANGADESVTEKLVEDFRTVANKGLPDGWVNLDEKQKLLVRQDAGRPHLRTQVATYNWDEAGVLGEEEASTVRLPPTSIAGDFAIEMTLISNEAWNHQSEGRKNRTLALTLKQKDETLVFRVTEGATGFVATLPGSDDSKPFTLAGKTPYRLRLERKAGTYRILNNTKPILTHAAEDQRPFDICELELSPKVLLGSIKIGPLTETPAKKPAPKPSK